MRLREVVLSGLLLCSVLATSSVVWEGGTNDTTTGISHQFTNLDITNDIIYVTVDVYQTDFFDSDEYVSSIIVNGHHIIDICNPNLDCMSFYYSCIIALDVSLYVDSYQNLNVSTVATDSVDNCPFKSFNFYVRYTLDIVSRPTGIPSFEPSVSVKPTISISPSNWPTSIPSSTPTTNERFFEDGSVLGTDGVTYTFENCDPDNNTYFLSVEVYQTDYFDSSEYVSAIVLNRQTISNYCNPGKDCAGSFYPCLEDEVVTRYIDSAGTLKVRVVATSSVDQCPFQGFALYVRYSLRSIEKALPTAQPSLSLNPSHIPTFTFRPTSSFAPTMSIQPTTTVVASESSDLNELGFTQLEVVYALIAIAVVLIFSILVGKIYKTHMENSKKNMYKMKRMKMRPASPSTKLDRDKARRHENTTEAKYHSKAKKKTFNNVNNNDRSRTKVVEFDLEDEEEGLASEDTPLKSKSHDDANSPTLPKPSYFDITTSPIRQAWTEDTEEYGEEPTHAYYDEKADNSEEENSFDYDEDSLNVRVKLKFGSSASVLHRTSCNDTDEFTSIGISDATEEPFMGHRL